MKCQRRDSEGCSTPWKGRIACRHRTSRQISRLLMTLLGERGLFYHVRNGQI